MNKSLEDILDTGYDLISDLGDLLNDQEEVEILEYNRRYALLREASLNISNAIKRLEEANKKLKQKRVVGICPQQIL